MDHFDDKFQGKCRTRCSGPIRVPALARESLQRVVTSITLQTDFADAAGFKLCVRKSDRTFALVILN